jgi:multidrug efflux pump subunit AcrB
VTLKTSANTKDVLSEIRNNVNRVSLPADAKTPVITEINSNANLAFSTFIYSRDTSMPEAVLRAHAQSIKTQIEAVPGIEKVEFDGKNTYDLEIVVPREKLEYLRISLDTIAATIRSSSRDVPIGNFAVGERKYDFRIE